MSKFVVQLASLGVGTLRVSSVLMLAAGLSAPGAAYAEAAEGAELTGEIEWSDGEVERIGEEEEVGFESSESGSAASVDSGDSEAAGGLSAEERATLDQELGEISDEQGSSGAAQVLQQIIIQTGGTRRRAPAQPPTGGYPTGGYPTGGYPTGGFGSPLDGPWGGKLTHPPPRFLVPL